MTNGEMVDCLIKWAVEFQKDTEYFERNKHMFGALGYSNPPDILQRDAVLTGFLNFASNKCCLDLGMYMGDFIEKVNS